MNIEQLVDDAVNQAQRNAAPFVPSRAEIEAQLQPVIADLRSLPREQQLTLFRSCKRIAGTWVVHVLNACKEAA